MLLVLHFRQFRPNYAARVYISILYRLNVEMCVETAYLHARMFCATHTVCHITVVQIPKLQPSAVALEQQMPGELFQGSRESALDDSRN